MNTDQLILMATFILSLSIASERLVEIIKGFVPALNKASDDPAAEGRRRSYLQMLAVVSGIVTAYLARDFIPPGIADPTNSVAIIGLGLLASGGSGLWNSVLTYLLQIKDLKKTEVDTAKKNLTSG